MAFSKASPFRCRKLVVLVLAACSLVVDAFSPGNKLRIVHQATLTPRFLAPRAFQLQAETTASVDEAVDQASLVLRADYVGESKTAPATSQEEMVDFFRDPVNCACLISAGNTRESHTVPTTDELLQKWKSRAASLGGEEPTASDVIISVRTGGIKFPGVTVESTSLIGSKLLLPTDSFPIYEFILIQDQREATGLKPIVWVYNQLTGANNKDRENDATPMSLSQVTPCLTEDGESVSFKIDSFLEIRVKFPKVLIKILPVSKEKAEAQGAEAVTKLLKKDIDVSIDKFRDIYTETVQSKSK